MVPTGSLGPSAPVGGGVGRRRAPRRRRSQLRRTVVRALMDLVGESYGGGIEARVRVLGAQEGC